MFDIFTAWEPLLKSKQEEITTIAGILSEKEASDITFTAVNPNDGSTDEYVLGSIEGNSKFLLGYVNPGFRLMPYHFIMIDPTISEEAAQSVYDTKGHPSNPETWAAFGLEPFLEGDKEGTPHESFQSGEKEEDNSYKFTFKGSSYVADPDNQLIYNESQDKVYHWSLLRNTFFAAQNEELSQLMDLHKVVKLIEKLPVVEKAQKFKGFDWSKEVPDLVKGVLPNPGSVLKITKNVYGVVGTDSIDFYNKKGEKSAICTSDGDFIEWISFVDKGVHSLLALDFFKSHLNVDVAALETYCE